MRGAQGRKASEGTLPRGAWERGGGEGGQVGAGILAKLGRRMARGSGMTSFGRCLIESRHGITDT